MTLDELLARIGPLGLRRAGKGYVARCPAHDDHAASLSLGEGEGGRILLHCFAGCAPEAVAAAYGLATSDLFPAARGEGAAIPLRAPATVQPRPGCTLSAYAAAKQLPEAFLASLGISEISYQGRPAVRMPYVGSDGAEVAVRFRLEAERGVGIEQPLPLEARREALPLRLGMLAAAREQGHVVLVEGESDAQTLLYQGIPALGVPGASSWQETWASELDDIETSKPSSTSRWRTTSAKACRNSTRKLAPLLKLRYHDSIADAIADLGDATLIGRIFAGFQKYLYEPQAAA